MADRTELVEAALDVYPEGLALLDSDERVVFWNRAAEQITGLPAHELRSRTVPDGVLLRRLGLRRRVEHAGVARPGLMRSPRRIARAPSQRDHLGDHPVLA